ncbi:MAG: RagB/SusD family nutrient uptake outer membrane protein [Chitinophagaceae bacterium]|nr:RagB/SusD family nutrient uptake outer membrane protein [Chitinophagaceae bacterium]
MKHRILLILILFTTLNSCKKFLTEHPSGFLTTSGYYTTPDQIRAAVNGTYAGLNNLFSSNIGVAESNIYPLEYITGYSVRPRMLSVGDEGHFLLLDNITNQNSFLEPFWTATFYPLENCNSVIANLTPSTVISGDTKKVWLGEVYFLRAWYYFQVVKLFGDVPLKTTPTTDLSDIRLGKSPQQKIYDQIVSDLQTAENAGLPWTDASGKVTLGAVKALLAKVYLTMAQYPLQKGSAWLQKAYDKSLELINSRQYWLFPAYDDLRNPNKQNTGEHIFMIQHNANNLPNIMHFSLMPFPEVPVSVINNQGGALGPRMEFHQSFDNGDVRRQERQFFYTHMKNATDTSQTITLPQPYIYKYWDSLAEQTKRSGANFGLIRYADILLVCAEAKCLLDGGSTQDPAAMDAWFAVHHRAFPTTPKPASLTFDEVYKERFWELCFEFQNWYDMIRTRKAFDVKNNKIVDLVGFQAPNHIRAFKEKDLLLPIPYVELLRDPNLQ